MPPFPGEETGAQKVHLYKVTELASGKAEIWPWVCYLPGPCCSVINFLDSSRGTVGEAQFRKGFNSSILEVRDQHSASFVSGLPPLPVTCFSPVHQFLLDGF